MGPAFKPRGYHHCERSIVYYHHTGYSILLDSRIYHQFHFFFYPVQLSRSQVFSFFVLVSLSWPRFNSAQTKLILNCKT